MTIEQSFPTGDAGSADPSDGGFATDPRRAAADAAGGTETHSDPDPSPGTGEAAPPGQSAASLLSDEEFAALRHDPVALRNAYERAARAAQDPRERALIDGLRNNPQATIKQLAQHLGMTVAEAEAAVEDAVEGEGADSSSLREFTLPPDLQQEFTEIVGEELAPRLVPAIAKLVDRLVQDTFGKDLQSVQTDLQTRQNEALVQQVRSEEEAFYSKRPEARQYRDEIDKLAEKLQPSNGMGMDDYLDMLLGVVLHQTGRAEGVAAERLQRGARVAATSPGRPGASPSQMRVPIGKVSFDKAAELAKRGIRING